MSETKSISLNGLRTFLKPLMRIINKKAETWEDLKEKPFGSEWEEQVLLDNISITLSEEIMGVDGAPLETTLPFKEGELYIVTYDDIVYECVAYYQDTVGDIVLGNGTIFGFSEGNEEPFFIAPLDGTHVVFGESNTTHTLTITTMGETIKKLDGKYLDLPSGILTTSNYLTTTAGMQKDNGEVFNNYGSNNANGYMSHAEGSGTDANGNYSHTEGQNTTANGEYSHAEGYRSIADKEGCHAEGRMTEANGQWSHAEGGYTKALENGSHAEGEYTIAEGDCSHAEGKYTHSYGINSHSEGYSSLAFGAGSHSEGYGIGDKCELTGIANSLTYTYLRTTGNSAFDLTGCIVLLEDGSYATVMAWKQIIPSGVSYHNKYEVTFDKTLSATKGFNTESFIFYKNIAYGISSHCEGQNTWAFGDYSHAEGLGTKANSQYQHVQGKYNTIDSSDTYIHIVGNGDTNNARSNAHTLDWNGNAWYQGEVYVGGVSQDDIATEKLVKQNELTAAKNNIALIDRVNGRTYILCMSDGELLSYCAISSIKVTTAPIKTVYMDGDIFDPSGMIITATTYDGVSKEITSGFIYSSKRLTEGSTSIDIKYIEDGITFTTTIPIIVEAFDPVIALVDFEYTNNNDGTYSIVSWKGTYNGETSTELIVPNNGHIFI